MWWVNTIEHYAADKNNRLDMHIEVWMNLKNMIHSKIKIMRFIAWYQRRQWHPTPVLLPGKSHGWRSLVGCGPWGR